MKTSRLIWLIFCLLAICVFGALLLESRTRLFHRLYDDAVLDDKNHYLPCDQLPTEAEVNGALEAHQDTVAAIQQVNPGHVGVEMDAFTCPGRADLVIWYASHQDRVAIESLLNAETFFGIPYRLQNR